MTFKLLCLGAAAALVIAPAALAQTSNSMGAQNPAPAAATPTDPMPVAPAGPARTADPSANVGSAVNANATVGGTAPDASCTTAAKKTAKRGAVNGSTPNCATPSGSQATPPAPGATAPAPNSMTPTTPR
ncbi:MAG TPA: hypothetical protein VGL73_11540 [Caulobacteraceae bacterium]|jgi:hypothetical protein